MARAGWKSRNLTIVLFETAILAVLLVAWNALASRGLGVFDWSLWIISALPLALSSMTQTLPLLAGGQGLAAGATASLVTIIVASAPIADTGSALVWIGIGLALGFGIGGANGLMIGYLRIPSTAVTVSTGIAVAAITQQLASGTLPRPPAEALHALVFAPTVSDIPVVPVVLIAGMLGIFAPLQRSRWGRALAALAARPPLAGGTGLPAARLRASAYAIAGLGYGATGIVLAAQLGSTDALFGAPLLLQIYAAVALGGSLPGLRGGTVLGSLLGALIVSSTANLFLPLGIDDFLSTAFDGVWLLAGIVLCRVTADHSLTRDFGNAAGVILAAAQSGLARWMERGYLQLGAGAAAFAFVIASGGADLPVIVLGLALLAVGQGAAMRAGGLDLSMPAMIAFGGMATVSVAGGRIESLPLALAVVAVGAVLAGLLHRGIAARWDRVAIPATLATAGVLQAASAWLMVRLPMGFAPPELTALMTGSGLGRPAPVLFVGLPLVLAVAIWLDRQWRAGGQGASLGAGYALSAIAAALFGVMMAGLTGEFRIGLVDTWLAPTLAAVLLGGIPFRGGSGSLVGAVGGVLLVQSADTVLVGIGLTSEFRLVVLAAAMIAASAFLSDAAERRAARPSPPPDAGSRLLSDSIDSRDRRAG